MQIQILSTAAMMGLGKVLPFSDQAQGTPQSMEFRTGEPIVCYRAKKDVAIDYESGMSLLILYREDTPVVFYLDRTVQLFPGTAFSIAPLGSACTARVFLHYGDALEAEPHPLDILSAAIPRLQITQIYTCFYQESGRDFYFRGERHRPYELTYMDTGTLHNLVNGTDLVLHQGELAIIPRDEWHMQYADEQVSFLTVTFDLAGDVLDPITGKALPLPAGARDALKRFLQERSGTQPFAYDYLESLLKVILIELMRSVSDRHSRPAILPSTTRSENQIVDQALQIIAQRSRRPPSLMELAAEVHVSVPYLCRLFDTHLGIPPGQYITKIRLEECKDLLRQGELSMGDIAAQMGFSSAQHFSRQFKHYCGLTPTEYTRSLR